MERHNQPTQDPETQRLRQQFALGIMQSMISNAMFMHGVEQRISSDDTIPEYVAEYAVKFADALLDELKRQEK